MLLGGCVTQSSLTAEATGCSRGSIDIIDSRYKREGTTSAWCARCQGKTYHCVSNAQRTRVECREENPGNVCQ